MLDFVLARVRKEPHLGSLQTFESDCDAPVSPVVRQTLGPFVTIPAFFFSSSPRNNYFTRFPQPCGRCAKALLGSLPEALFHGNCGPFLLAPCQFAWGWRRFSGAQLSERLLTPTNPVPCYVGCTRISIPAMGSSRCCLAFGQICRRPAPRPGITVLGYAFKQFYRCVWI